MLEVRLDLAGFTGLLALSFSTPLSHTLPSMNGYETSAMLIHMTLPRQPAAVEGWPT